jgi:glycosyltransferase involved in cell wall biosynthesis
LQRCIYSVLGQTFGDFEHIIVDDGSVDNTQEVVASYEDGRIRYVYIEHAGRVIARNAGMERARGRWHLWLDSDDALDVMYLKTVDYYAGAYPEARWFICGAVVHGFFKEDGQHVCPKWTKIRPAWMPPVTEGRTNYEFWRAIPVFDARSVHSHFPSGKFGTGQFIYHREVYEAIGNMPEWRNHNRIADGVDEWLGYETGYNSKTKLVGNPNGEDWAYIRRISQLCRAELIPAALYIHYVR